MLVRAVFLDRDGVINRAIVREGKPYPPHSLLELEILPGVAEALAALRKAGFLLIVVTNQPDVARGSVSKMTVESINVQLSQTLPLDAFYTCYHDTADNCDCRKPKPGSLLKASHEHKIDLSQSFMIGDRSGDMEAGQKAGCKTIFVDYGYNEKRPESFDYIVSSLLEAAKIIMEGS